MIAFNQKSIAYHVISNVDTAVITRSGFTQALLISLELQETEHKS